MTHIALSQDWRVKADEESLSAQDSFQLEP